MRRYLQLTVFVIGAAAATAAYSQNDLPPAGQPGGPGAAAPQGGQGRQQGTANDAQYRAQVSYGLGRNFAMNLKGNHIDCDLQALMAGISDALSGAQPKWSDQQLETVLTRFQNEMEQKEMARIQQEAAKNQQEETAFLAQNGKRQGVQSTPSGLQYRVIQQGQGPSPSLNDTVKCNYRGTLLNGTEFDSSTRQGGPAAFPLKRVIPGWTEALQKMHVGDKWQLYVPSKLAYGMQPPGPPIEAGCMLVFDIELLGIENQQAGAGAGIPSGNTRQ